MWLGCLALLICVLPAGGQQSAPPHLFFHVTLGPSFHEPVSGRLLVFVAPGAGAKAVDLNEFAPAEVYIAAREVINLAPGATVDIDADDTVFPEPLSSAKPGDYSLQAVLDVGHNYNYRGRRPEDPISDVIALKDPSTISNAPIIVLNAREQPAQGQPSPKPSADRETLADQMRPIDFVSPALTRFWGRDIHMFGTVLLPPGYVSHPDLHYPTVYFTHGFGGDLQGINARYAPMIHERMSRKKMPEMIWVLLDESSPTGTHEFADSVNNGPWGTALTSELIPALESKYRMDARANGRFLNGHSSGGWATLWLQVSYPKIFGGTWSTSPDPSDFHDFTGPDLYATHANIYRQDDGTPRPIIRDHGKVMATWRDLARLEPVLGEYGGQAGSFEWVFSPRGEDGRPLPLFNRATGDVDPAVAAYWCEHYDISHLVEVRWPSIGSDLRGKIHLIVGTADTFYLDGPAHKFEAVLQRLGADPHFTYLPDRTHFDLYKVGDDPVGMFDQIAGEMYAVARPAK
jgi:Putative esterase